MPVAVKAAVLSKVIEFCKHHADNAMPPIPKVHAAAAGACGHALGPLPRRPLGRLDGNPCHRAARAAPPPCPIVCSPSSRLTWWVTRPRRARVAAWRAFRPPRRTHEDTRRSCAVAPLRPCARRTTSRPRGT